MEVTPLQGKLGGSGRKIIRLSAGASSAIGILYDVREENVAFLEFSRHFRRHGLPVPEIYGEDLSQGAYLEEDLGSTTLFEFLSKHRRGENLSPEAVEAYRKVIAVLPRFQVEAGRDLNYRVCYPRGSFDRQSIAWDLNYFKYYFLRLAGIPFNEQALEDDFSRLTKFLLSAGHDYFLYRDFQSRNIMTFPKSDADLPHPVIPPLSPEDEGQGSGVENGPTHVQSKYTVHYDEGAKVGYKWYESEHKQPLFPFGFGLSYTTYAYSNLKADNARRTVSFVVKNTGKRAGAEIAQVYAALPEAAGEPFKRLVGWQRIELAPGESKTVTVAADSRVMSIFDEQRNAWNLLPGAYKIFAGPSSGDTPLTATLQIQ